MAKQFREEHLYEYGLAIASHDINMPTNITSVVCKFCVFFGREEKSTTTRGKIKTIKYFTAPFRPLLYRQHLTNQHPAQYSNYKDFIRLKGGVGSGDDDVNNVFGISGAISAGSLQQRSNDEFFERSGHPLELLDNYIKDNSSVGKGEEANGLVLNGTANTKPMGGRILSVGLPSTSTVFDFGTRSFTTLPNENITLPKSLEGTWQLAEDRRSISREFEFGSFVAAFGFMTQCALLAEKMNHHPEWFNVYGTVKVRLTTHDAKQVTFKDFRLAEEMNKVFHKVSSQ